jgi:hypothetical protein
MNASKDIGKRLYTVQAPDYGYAKAFVMADLAINGLQALEIECSVDTLEGRWHTRSNGQPLDTED